MRIKWFHFWKLSSTLILRFSLKKKSETLNVGKFENYHSERMLFVQNKSFHFFEKTFFKRMRRQKKCQRSLAVLLSFSKNWSFKLQSFHEPLQELTKSFLFCNSYLLLTKLYRKAYLTPFYLWLGWRFCYLKNVFPNEWIGFTKTQLMNHLVKSSRKLKLLGRNFLREQQKDVLVFGQKKRRNSLQWLEEEKLKIAQQVAMIMLWKH